MEFWHIGLLTVISIIGITATIEKTIPTSLYIFGARNFKTQVSHLFQNPRFHTNVYKAQDLQWWLLKLKINYQFFSNEFSLISAKTFKTLKGVEVFKTFVSYSQKVYWNMKNFLKEGSCLPCWLAGDCTPKAPSIGFAYSGS